VRKEKIVTVALGDGNRDNGRQFKLTEMPAAQAEKWAIRATVALAHSGVDIPEEMLGAGWAALAYGALQALHNVKYEDLVPLLDEMMQCIQAVIPPPADNPSLPPQIRSLVDSDIEEVATRFWLRAELFSLHAGFSLAGAISTSAPARGNATRSAITRTSRRRLARP
jgi:hypothetical protein